jgi:hypothetical protein
MRLSLHDVDFLNNLSLHDVVILNNLSLHDVVFKANNGRRLPGKGKAVP